MWIIVEFIQYNIPAAKLRVLIGHYMFLICQSLSHGTTQIDQQSSYNLNQNTPPSEVLQKRYRSIQWRFHIRGRPWTPTKYRSEFQMPWKTVTTLHNPCMSELMCYRTEYRDGTESYSEAFNPDDPTLLDRYPRYVTDTGLGDRPNNGRCVSREKSKKKTEITLVSMKIISQQYLQKASGWLPPYIKLIAKEQLKHCW